MSKQDYIITRNNFENNILDLEKFYFTKILEILKSECFISDLLLIEKEISDNYPKYKNIWNLKNKLKIPAERIVRHYMYIQLHESIKGVYSSPVSSDLGIKSRDAIICIDVKTLDTHGNSGDIKSTSVEKNQTSFDNKNYPYIPTLSNLDAIDHYSRLPVLTYVIKIIYTDDGYSFKLSREDYPTVVLASIPNGEISKLFDYNIIENFKTYDYLDNNSTFKPIYIPSGLPNIREYIDDLCINTLKFNKINIDKKIAYYDAKQKTIWWETSHTSKKCLRALKCGSTVRFYNKYLKERYDSSNKYWDGYIEIKL